MGQDPKLEKYIKIIEEVVLIKADRNKREKFIKYLKKMEVVEV
ncbi:MAG: hypothetical protein ACTSR0_06440 [Candidatus Asgardarchaeia archaeon]